MAEQVKRYAQTHEITRTDAIELFIRTALDDPDRRDAERAYTAHIQDFEWGTGGVKDGVLRIPRRESVEDVVKGQLRSADRYAGEYGENEALTARLPGDVVGGIEAWSEHREMPKSVAAADLLERGLEADPLPDENPDPWPDHVGSYDGGVKTVEFSPEEADLFRRCRLYYRKGPSEAVNTLLNAYTSTSSARVGWEKPDETGG